MTTIALFRTKLVILGAIGIAALTWTARAHASVSCDGSWTDDRGQSSPTITFPNNNSSYSPAEILVAPGQTVVWDGTSSSATFNNYPLVSSLWGTFTSSSTTWPFTYRRSGGWEYHDGNNTSMEGIVCVTGPFVATFTHSPSSANPNQTVTFDGSGSSEHWATITDYQWDFGSGAFSLDSGATSTSTHVFSKAGIYKVRLKVTDDAGYTMIKTEQVTIGAVITKAPKLLTTTVKKTSHGTVRLRVENPNAISANGHLTLTRSTKSGAVQIGSASFTDPAGGTVTVSVPLSRGAKRYLSHHKHLTAKAKIVLSAHNTSKAGVWTITIDR